MDADGHGFNPARTEGVNLVSRKRLCIYAVPRYELPKLTRAQYPPAGL